MMLISIFELAAVSISVPSNDANTKDCQSVSKDIFSIPRAYLQAITPLHIPFQFFNTFDKMKFTTIVPAFLALALAAAAPVSRPGSKYDLIRICLLVN